MSISIIGNLYKFSDHEIKILTNKQFKVYFYDDLELSKILLFSVNSSIEYFLIKIFNPSYTKKVGLSTYGKFNINSLKNRFQA